MFSPFRAVCNLTTYANSLDPGQMPSIFANRSEIQTVCYSNSLFQQNKKLSSKYLKQKALTAGKGLTPSTLSFQMGSSIFKIGPVSFQLLRFFS